MPIMPSLAIFSTVSLGKYSSASTFLARGLTSFSANSLYIFWTICCCLDRVKSIDKTSIYWGRAILPDQTNAARHGFGRARRVSY